jgi:hypothetical protein
MSRTTRTREAAGAGTGSRSPQDSSYTVFGHPVTIHWMPDCCQTARERLDALLGPCSFPGTELYGGTAGMTTAVDVGGPDPDRVWTYRYDGNEERILGEDELLRQLERTAIGVAALHSTVPLILHAGAVERAGSAVLLPAHSGSGKTTLTLALGARGWLPLTDDVCPCVIHDGTVFTLPSPRCVHLSNASREVLGNLGIALQGPVAGLPGYFRPGDWGASAPIRRIIIPRYLPGKKTTLVPLTMAEVAAQMLRMRFERASLPREVQWNVVLQLARQARGWRLLYSSLDEAFDVVEQLTQPTEVTS